MADILIVDDHEQVRAVMREILQGEEHSVREASDGATALSLARERAPDIVFLDLQMPDMDGMEVLRALRDDESTRSARVVILTARGDRDRQAGLELGAEAYFVKPFSPLAVLELVERLTAEA
ncbi:MAG TPA: response regulator [Actinomycetota bacterium]|nr:response regulator [Actinomycetota bacterium]